MVRVGAEADARNEADHAHVANIGPLRQGFCQCAPLGRSCKLLNVVRIICTLQSQPQYALPLPTHVHDVLGHHGPSLAGPSGNTYTDAQTHGLKTADSAPLKSATAICYRCAGIKQHNSLRLSAAPAPA